jgi:hypothetical protein
MQIDFIDIIYDNFITILITMAVLLFMFSGTILYNWIQGIGVRVLFIKKNTAQWIKAKEPSNEYLIFGGKIAIRSADPKVIKMGRRAYRLFLVDEADRLTKDIAKSYSKILGKTPQYVTGDIEKTDYSKITDEELKKEVTGLKEKLASIIEEKIVEQSVKGFMSQMKVPFLTILGYMATGFMIAVVLQAVLARG